MKRVVITGMSQISPLGANREEAFEKLLSLKNCVKYMPDLEQYTRLNTKLAAPADKFVIPSHYNRKTLRTMGRVGVLSVVSAEEALKDAGLLGNEIITNGQTGVSYGSSTGSLDTLIDFYSMMVDKEVKGVTSGSYVKMMAQTSCVNISLYFKTTGRIIPTSTACTSGSMGIGYAYEAIKNGYQTVMIAGGADELHPTQIAIFDTLYATSQKNANPELTPSPFDKNRDGLVIGEGAGTMILEEYEHAKKRGAKIYGEIIGFGTSTDGTHITSPNRDKMISALELALKDADISSDKIDYVNAHGTATIQGDVAETNATYDVFKRAIPISSIKSYTGHTLGACGAVEAILTLDMAHKGWFCPTINLNNVDDECGKLDYIKSQGREINTNIVMSNNFAFGGINTSLIFKVHI